MVNTAAAPAGSSGNGGPAAASKLNTPFAVAVDPSTDDLYIADTSTTRSRDVHRRSPSPTTTAGGPVAPSQPRHHH